MLFMIRFGSNYWVQPLGQLPTNWCCFCIAAIWPVGSAPVLFASVINVMLYLVSCLEAVLFPSVINVMLYLVSCLEAVLFPSVINVMLYLVSCLEAVLFPSVINVMLYLVSCLEAVLFPSVINVMLYLVSCLEAVLFPLVINVRLSNHLFRGCLVTSGSCCSTLACMLAYRPGAPVFASP
ncbi:hypothetical protein BsWGS_29139 [Bradybaena similaris]